MAKRPVKNAVSKKPVARGAKGKATAAKPVVKRSYWGVFGSWMLKLLIISVVGAVCVAIVAPKPKVVSYRKSGIISESVYWSDWFFADGKFSDAQSAPFALNEDRGFFYVCLDVESQQNCQRYDIVETKGVFESLSYIMNK